jgi:predicted DNA-binding transcriptional regulator AlpA
MSRRPPSVRLADAVEPATESPSRPGHHGPADVPGVRPADQIEPLLRQLDLERVLSCSSRTLERLRSAGRLPRPDLHVGRSPRWRAETIRRWIESGGRA